MNISTNAGVWVAALLTVGLFSWMYKENPWFRVVEHIYVGAQVGHLAIVGLQNVQEMAWKPLTQGNMLLILPLAGGVMLFSRWSRKYAYLSRVPVAYIMATTAAVLISGTIKSSFLDQITATMKLGLTSVNNVIFVISCVSATAYFLFTLDQKSIAGPVTLGGRYALMVAFGAAFGYTVMSRISLFTGRMQFLLGDWLGLIR